MKAAYYTTLAVTCLSAFGMTITPKVANALSIFLEGGAPTFSNGIYTYNYTIELDADDSLEGNEPFQDTLDFTELFEVTDATANDPYGLISPSSFDSISASFEVISDQTGAATFSNVITLESTAGAGFVDYRASFSDNGTPTFIEGQILGPSATPIPFEFSPGLGLLFLGATLGTRHLLQQRKSQND